MLKLQPKYQSRGFTMLELLVVIAIIGLLSSVVLVATSGAREKTKIVRAVGDLRALNQELNIYAIDTGQRPPPCDSLCTSITDPFLNSLGVPGWRGPYMSLWDKKHPWGGHLSVFTVEDRDGDGVPDCVINLNDDAPGYGSGDNSGQVPATALLAIDKMIDDGVLSTGEARGNGEGWFTVQGELSWRCGI